MPLSASRLCQLSGKHPSALQGAAAVLPCPAHPSPYSAGVTRMPSLPGCPPGVPHRQHPTATLRVTAENSDPTFGSHTNTCGFFIFLSLLSTSSSAPTLPVAWDGCKLDNKKVSLFQFLLILASVFQGWLLGGIISLFPFLLARLPEVGSVQQIASWLL